MLSKTIKVKIFAQFCVWKVWYCYEPRTDDCYMTIYHGKWIVWDVFLYDLIAKIENFVLMALLRVQIWSLHFETHWHRPWPWSAISHFVLQLKQNILLGAQTMDIVLIIFIFQFFLDTEINTDTYKEIETSYNSHYMQCTSNVFLSLMRPPHLRSFNCQDWVAHLWLCWLLRPTFLAFHFTI